MSVSLTLRGARTTGAVTSVTPSVPNEFVTTGRSGLGLLSPKGSVGVVAQQFSHLGEESASFDRRSLGEMTDTVAVAIGWPLGIVPVWPAEHSYRSRWTTACPNGQRVAHLM